MKTLADHINSIQNQKVLVRCNFDVPIDNSQVQDTTRIEAAIPTLKLLLGHNNSLILLAHYDRPDGKPDHQKSLEPVVPVLEKLLHQSVSFVKYESDYRQLTIPNNNITLIENLRFWPDEEANTPEFSLHLASLGESYVNEAFANCHRSHASIVGLPQHLPSFAGLELSQEVASLSRVRLDPEKPLIVVIGGAKLETKEPLITAFADLADHILVGGKSAVDLSNHPHAKQPNVTLAELTPDKKDITEAAAKQFAEIIMQAKTVIWNGTMGIFEDPKHQLGTRVVAEAVNSTPAFTLIGGGDTEAALTQLNLQSGIDHVCTGGGAMLTFLCDGKLVGVDALK